MIWNLFPLDFLEFICLKILALRSEREEYGTLLTYLRGNPLILASRRADHRAEVAKYTDFGIFFV